MKELEGRVALVTGGTRGIGWACVEALVRAGASVVLTWHSDKLQAVEALRAARGLGDASCETVAYDQSDPKGVSSVIDFVTAKMGRLDILVNNAGIWNRTETPLVSMSDEALSAMIQTNLMGAMRLTREAAKVMIENGHGRIINIGSTAGIRGEAGHSHYAATKGALFAFTRSLVPELGPHGITVNVVSPGWVFTDMTSPVLTDAYVEQIESQIPTRRLSRPDDIASAVRFLASESAGQITGANIDVNGGAVFS